MFKRNSQTCLCGCVGVCFYAWKSFKLLLGQLAWAASPQRGKTLSTSVLDMTLNNLMAGLQSCWVLEQFEVPPALPWLPGSLWPGVVVLDKVLSMGQIEQNCNYDKLNCLKLTVFIFNPLNCVLIQDWIVWNITVLTFNCV